MTQESSPENNRHWSDHIEEYRRKVLDPHNEAMAREFGPFAGAPKPPKEGEIRAQAGMLPPPPEPKPATHAREPGKPDPEFVKLAESIGLTPEDAVRLTKLFR